MIQMSIELPAQVEEQLRQLAVRQNRDIDALVEEAVRWYLEAGAITDLDAAEVAETQMTLAGELRRVAPWKGDLILRYRLAGDNDD
jgi:predicted transcriptional regulator